MLFQPITHIAPDVVRFCLVSTALLGITAASKRPSSAISISNSSLSSVPPSPQPQAVTGGLRVIEENASATTQSCRKPNPTRKSSRRFPGDLVTTVNKPTAGGKAGTAEWQEEAARVAPNEAAVVAEREKNMAPKIQAQKKERGRLFAKGNSTDARRVKPLPGSDPTSKIHVEQQLGKEVQKIRGGNTLPPTNTGSVQGPSHFTQSQKPTSFKPGCVDGPNQPGCGPVNDECQHTGEPTTNYVKPADIPAADKASLAAKDGAAKARQATAAQAQKSGGTA
ncbi:hypothetical protein B9Z65_6091 [Elsinoe australis]|uniref:Uncharacterized protein n=1 Tax=Elsinoe australis TaxID=40998 RepID=A0A2P8A7L9_9PEZI|nr:hypothetical protein B9Z65_6091 [Elsinoe australis]